MYFRLKSFEILPYNYFNSFKKALKRYFKSLKKLVKDCKAACILKQEAKENLQKSKFSSTILS